KTQLHDEIVKYFKSSPGRYDKDSKTGLSTTEFTTYKSAMVSKVKELMTEYAPTEEDIAAMKKAKEESEKAGKAAENIKPFDPEAVQESPGEIADLNVLGTKFEEYNGWNQSLQKEGMDVITATEAVQAAYKAYKKARDGIGAYKKFTGYIWPEDDKERIAIQTKVDEAKKKVSEAQKKFEDNKGKLKAYGEGLSAASDKQKEGKVTERDEAIKKIEDKTTETEEAKTKREEQFKKLSARQQEMIAERDNLVTYSEEVSKSKDAAETRKQTAEMKKGELSQFDASVQASLKKIEDSLKEPGLSEEDKAQLEEAKKTLLEKQKEVGVGLRVCGEVLDSETGAVSKLTEEETASANRTLALKSHLEDQVSPAIGAMNKSIATLESAKLQFATNKEQVNAHFEEAFKTFDNVDAAVDNAVLKNNLANEKINGQLASCKKSLDAMDTSPPQGLLGAFESTIGIPFAMAGGAVSEFGAFCLDQAVSLSRSLESSRSEMSTFAYVAARIGVEIVSLPIGVAGGLLEMGGGLINMVAHPIDTAKGLGTLIGLNSEVSAGTAWKEMGKALISWDDFKHGHIGIGLGKLFANVVTTVTGAGAVGAGGKAAQATYQAARAAGKGVAVSLGKATMVGGKVAVTFIGEEVASGTKTVAKGLGKGVKAAPGAFIDAAKAVPGIAKKAPGVVADIARAAPGKAKSAIKYIGGSFESVGKGMIEGSKSLFTAEGRANSKLAKAAGQEAKYADELQKGQPKYKEFEDALQKMREENPNLSEADLRLKFAQENPKLNVEGVKFEENLQKFEQAQKAFEAEITKGMSPETLEKTKLYLEMRKNAQKRMIESSGEYQKFVDALGKKDPNAEKVAKEFEKALASGDQNLIDSIILAHPEFKDALMYIEDNLRLQVASEKIMVNKLTTEIDTKLVKFEGGGPELMQKYAEELNKRYPNLPKGEGRVLCNVKGYAIVLDNEGKIHTVKINILDEVELNKRIMSGEAVAGAEEIAAIEMSIVHRMKTGSIEPHMVTSAVRNGLIQPTDEIVRLMIGRFNEMGAPGFFDLPGVVLSPKQQLTLIDKIIAEKAYFLLDGLPVNYFDPVVLDAMAGRIDKMVGTIFGMNKAEELVLAGRAPLTEKMIEVYLKDKGNVHYIDALLANQDVVLAKGLTREVIAERVRMAKDKFADMDWLGKVRDPLDPQATAKLKVEVQATINAFKEKIKSGQVIDAQNEFGKVLLRLKERDPVGFQMILDSDGARLVGTECLDGIISGNKLEKVDKFTGEKVTVYLGKQLGEGGMGIVYNGAFYVPGQKGLTFGGFKIPKSTTSPALWRAEIDGSRLATSWNHPNIMQSLHAGDDFIIFETGEKAQDLHGFLNDPTTSATEYFSAMRDVTSGLKEYRKHGYFHGDLKEGNVLRFKVGVDAAGNDVYAVKIIDNSPVLNDNFIDLRFPRTPTYTFEGAEMVQGQRSLMSHGVTPERTSFALGQATDPRALSTMMRNAFNRFVPNWESNTQLTTLVADLKDPVKTSNPQYLADLEQKLNKIITDMSSGNMPTYAPAPKPVPAALQPPTVKGSPPPMSPPKKPASISDNPTLVKPPSISGNPT
ncbi:hypothetical protein IT413_05495, partial [Candidatus Peregrinibacteria bacterium]|nr:hypothetical protein [Candidatus Peregrinibacteria bacterium]